MKRADEGGEVVSGGDDPLEDMVFGVNSRSSEGRTPAVQRVVVRDIQMPFGSMVVFMVKWAIAAIPALFILILVAGVAWGLMAGLVAPVLALLADSPVTRISLMVVVGLLIALFIYRSGRD